MIMPELSLYDFFKYCFLKKNSLYQSQPPDHDITNCRIIGLFEMEKFTITMVYRQTLPTSNSLQRFSKRISEEGRN